MWVLRNRSTPGVDLRRRILILATSLIVAIFAVIGPLTRPAGAVNATWTGSELTYNGDTYTETTSAITPPNQGDKIGYQWIDTSSTPNKAHVLYFDRNNPGVPDSGPQAKTSANYIVYDMPNYTNPSATQPVVVERDLTVSANGENQSDLGTTCDSSTFHGIGWILCPVSNWLADAVDAVYRVLEDFLRIDTITTDTKTNTGVYQVWELVRSLANVCFVVAFLVIIYSQLTSIGLSSHNIKVMVPRLIIAAILVNASYIISSLAVDVSNLLGYSIQSILVGIRENYAMTPFVDWNKLTGAILGGSAAIATLGFAAAAGGSLPSLGFLIIGALVSAALSVLVGFVILAARQAIITLLVVISPLAFVAYLLPSTQSLFEKWRKSFTTLLVFFPLFALLFGGSQLAGAIIINSQQPPNGQLHIVIMGLMVQVVPLILTPLLVRFSTGILGTIANMANNSKRGLADRAKNWAQDNADMHALRKKENMAEKRKNRMEAFKEKDEAGKVKRFKDTRRRFAARNGISPGGLALRMDQNKRLRDHHKKQAEEVLGNMSNHDWDKRLNNPREASTMRRVASRVPLIGLDKRSLQERTADQARLAHTLQKQGEREKELFAAKNEEEWTDYESSTAGQHYRNLRTETAKSQGRQKVNDGLLAEQDTEAVEQMISDSPTLTRVISQTHRAQRRAEKYKEIVQKAAEKSWSQHIKNDANTQDLVMRTELYTDSAKLAEQQTKNIIQEVHAQGGASPHLLSQTAKDLATSIKEVHIQTDAAMNAEKEAVQIQHTEVAKAYEASQQLVQKAAGIGGAAGEVRVKSRAKTTAFAAIKESIDSIENTWSQKYKTDTDKLYATFTTKQIDIDERIALLNAMSKNGSGSYEQMLKAITWYQTKGGAGGGPLSVDELADFKELIAMNSAIREGGRDVELFLSDGGGTRTLDTYTSDVNVWDIGAGRFAAMTKGRQLAAITALKKTPEGRQRIKFFAERLWEDAQSKSRLKPEVTEELGKYIGTEE